MNAVKPVSAKKQYRQHVKFAKQIIKGIEVLVEGGEDFRNLDEALRAAGNLQIVAANLEHYINQLKAGA